jgi:N-carbamoylputrescine amidase
LTLFPYTTLFRSYILQSFDLEALAKLRYSWGVFRDRRPDLYGDLIKK